MRASRFLLAPLLVAFIAACPGGKGLPGTGGSSIPGKGDLPGGGNVPGGLGGDSGMVDPNTCGNYAAMEGGNRLKAFLQATLDLERVTTETAMVVRQSCIMLGTDIGMVPADLEAGETKDICARVWGQIKENLKVSVGAKAKLKFKVKPAVCKVDIRAQADAAAQCEGKASADIKARCDGTCSGTCNGKCSGKAGTGGNSGQCNGTCEGTCEGSCEGSADVDASAECRAHANVQASANVQCEPAQVDISFEAKAVLDKSRAEATINALKKGLPELLSLDKRLRPIKAATAVWVQTAKDLKDMGPKFVNSFKDQALCISGQISAVFNSMTKIEANVSVSVEVSAEASGTVGGG